MHHRLAIMARAASRSFTFLIPPALAGMLAASWPQRCAAQGATAPTTVLITGNPLGSNELIAPAVAYQGIGLLLRSRSTLGETLDGTPGVASTYFGPNASLQGLRAYGHGERGAGFLGGQAQAVGF